MYFKSDTVVQYQKSYLKTGFVVEQICIENLHSMGLFASM